MIDEIQKERIEREFKIPVDISSPGKYWIISLDCESEMPTDQELAQLKSYCEFTVKRIYTETYQHKILVEKDLPSESMHNTTVFKKGSPNNPNTWFYKKIKGIYYFPRWGTEEYKKFHSLLDIMDKYETIFPERWQAWKKEHPDIFHI